MSSLIVNELFSLNGVNSLRLTRLDAKLEMTEVKPGDAPRNSDSYTTLTEEHRRSIFDKMARDINSLLSLHSEEHLLWCEKSVLIHLVAIRGTVFWKRLSPSDDCSAFKNLVQLSKLL